MRQVDRRSFLAGLIGTGLGAGLWLLARLTPSAVAQSSRALDEQGFVPLFDGKTLTGWHLNEEKNIHGTGGKWEVEDGVLIGDQDPPGSGGLLLSDQEFGDFDLEAELNPDWGVDTGIFIRTNSQGFCYQVFADYHDHGLVGWMSFETGNGQKRVFIRPFNFFGKLDAQGKLESLSTKPDERAIAWKPDYLLYSATPQTFLSAWKIGQWNTLRIRCVGEYPRITTWINGIKIAEFDAATCPHPGYRKNEALKQVGRKGRIALQIHPGQQNWIKGGKCRWRNIRLKTL